MHFSKKQCRKQKFNETLIGKLQKKYLPNSRSCVRMMSKVERAQKCPLSKKHKYLLNSRFEKEGKMQKAEIASGEIYTINDMAEMLRVSTWTIRTLVKSGKLPHVKIGNQYRFCGWQIRDWLNAKSRQNKKQKKAKESI